MKETPITFKRPTWASWLPVAVLLSVALLQALRVYHGGLTPWKGGGFGMFSTIESPSSRVIKAYLLIGEERTPVLVPENFRKKEQDLRAFPTAPRAQELAQELARQQWAPYRMVPMQEHYRHMYEQYNAEEMAPALQTVPLPSPSSLDNAAYLNTVFEQLNFLRALKPGETAEHIIAFQQVEVEVWQLALNHQKEKLYLHRLLISSAPRDEKSSQQ